MSVTSILTRQINSPARRGDHVRDELHLYTVDRVTDHLADGIGEYVLNVHDEDGTPYVVFGSEVVRCGTHERPLGLADAARQLRAAGYRTRVSQLAPDRLIAHLDRGPLRAVVFLSTRPVGIRAVGLYRSVPPSPAELVMFEFSTPRAGGRELFTVEDVISRAVALADEVKATVR